MLYVVLRTRGDRYVVWWDIQVLISMLYFLQVSISMLYDEIYTCWLTYVSTLVRYTYDEIYTCWLTYLSTLVRYTYDEIYTCWSICCTLYCVQVLTSSCCLIYNEIYNISISSSMMRHTTYLSTRVCNYNIIKWVYTSVFMSIAYAYDALSFEVIFPQKSPMISRSFAERDLQLKASYYIFATLYDEIYNIFMNTWTNLQHCHVKVSHCIQVYCTRPTFLNG